MEDHDGAGWPEHADDMFADPEPHHGEEDQSQGATEWADTDWASASWASPGGADADGPDTDRPDTGELHTGEPGTDEPETGEIEAGGADGSGLADTPAQVAVAPVAVAPAAVAPAAVAPVAVALTVPRPETGEPRVDDALSLLDDLPELPVAEHPEVFARVHARLGEVLGELASGPLAGAAGRDGS
jgi:hypothetical protein